MGRGKKAFRMFFAGILPIGLVSAYSILMVCAVALIRDYPPGHIIDRVAPYGIPPLLSFSCAAFLSIFVLTLEQTRTESLLFALSGAQKARMSRMRHLPVICDRLFTFHLDRPCVSF